MKLNSFFNDEIQRETLQHDLLQVLLKAFGRVAQ